MNTRFAAAAPLLVAGMLAVLAGGCAKSSRGGAGVGEACAVETDCAKGLTCSGGACQLAPGSALCAANTRLCDGSDVVLCNATGQSTSVVQSCPSGCEAGACLDPACALGARRCASDGVEQCGAGPNGTRSWQLVQACQAGCDAATLSCNALACNPLAVRCSPTNPANVQTCAIDGSQWVDQPCGAGSVCANGACSAAPCTAGAQRCGEGGIEVCASVDNGAPGWVLAQACPLGCNAQALSCIELTCKPLDVRCSPSSPNTVQSCAADGSGWVDASACSNGSVCDQGLCAAPTCVPNSATCQGSALVVCDATGSGSASATSCPHGCANGACVAAGCTPGELQCSGSTLQVCATDGSGFTLAQSCGANACVTLGAGLAACGPSLCSPLSRRCGADGASVQTCSADGSAWGDPVSCGVGASCSGGVCTAPPAGCTQGAEQCAGAVVQQCQSGAWVSVGACFGACSAGGSCTGGSCSAQVPVAIPLPACAATTCAPPADGVSSLLGVAGPLVDSAGAMIPDGTLVTVAATGGAAITAADADPNTPGIQVRSVSGYADFSFRAPPSGVTGLGAHVVVTAQVGASALCAGSAAVDFAPPGNWAYAAEDFTTASRRDLVNTSADWRTDLGFAESLTSPFGTGADGALDVSTLGANGTWDLAQTPRGAGLPPFAPSLQVVGLDAQAAQVQGSTAGFAAGDEVLLLELQGASLTSTSAAGAWELLIVASVADGRIAFRTPVLGTYGAGPGMALAGEKVALQRVPQFTSVNVPAGSTLTASAWDGTQGGVVALRASGTVSVAGAISADAIGFRGGSSSSTTVNQSGESYGGQPAPVSAASARNLGAGGGGYLLCDPNHLDQLDSWYGAGGSYGSAGVAGSSTGTPAAAITAGRAACLSTQGLPYGTPSLARFFLGSGSGTQQENSHGACSTATCPAESSTAWSTAFQGNDDLCGTLGHPACLTPFTVCAAETKSYAAAYETAGASSCNTTLNANCAQTLSVCGATAPTSWPNGGRNMTVGHGAVTWTGSTCTPSATCADTNSVCAADKQTVTAAKLPCAAGDSNCNAAIYGVCSAYNVSHTDSPYPGTDCSTSCPGLVQSAYDCGHCGCSLSNPRLCNYPTCNSVYSCNPQYCYPGGCGDADNTTTVVYKCTSGGDTCSNTGDDCNTDTVHGTTYTSQYCDPNTCNAIGTSCECYYKCALCYDGPQSAANSGSCEGENCNTCNVCTGCVTNPGCFHNPGCSTNIGCKTNSGCNTCGGKTSWDGSSCDFTAAGNACKCPAPWQGLANGGRGGGAIFLAAATLDLSGGGRVSARGGAPALGFAGGSGGSLWVRTGTLHLAAGSAVQLDARGAANAGDGRLRLDRAGGDDPVATSRALPVAYAPSFIVPQAQSLSMLPATGKSAVSAQLVPMTTAQATSLLEGTSPQVAELVSSDGGKTFTAVAPGSTVNFAASGDVRFRATFAPRPGAPARTAAMLWLFQLQSGGVNPN